MYLGSGAQLKARLGWVSSPPPCSGRGEKQANTLICHGIDTRPLHQQSGPLIPCWKRSCHHYEAGLDRAPQPQLPGPDPGAAHPAPWRQADPDKPPSGAGQALCQQLQRLACATTSTTGRSGTLEAALPDQGQLAVHRANAAAGSMGQPLFRARYQAAADEQAAASQQQLLPLVTAPYRLDNGLHRCNASGRRLDAVCSERTRPRSPGRSSRRRPLQGSRAASRHPSGAALETEPDPRLPALGWLLIAHRRLG